jgi:hypothetical protein
VTDVSKTSALGSDNVASTLVARRVAIGALALIGVFIWFASIGYRTLAEFEYPTTRGYRADL